MACVYASNRTFFDDISNKIDPTVPTVLCGDFNTVFDQSVDRRGSVVTDLSRESSVALARLFNDAFCNDIWHFLHPTTQGFTWSRADGLVSSHIDVVGCPMFGWPLPPPVTFCLVPFRTTVCVVWLLNVHLIYFFPVL